MKRISVVLLCMVALVTMVMWVPNVGAFELFETSTGASDNCKECHTLFDNLSAEHNAMAGLVGSVCAVCHGGFPPALTNCDQCHLGPGLRAHHENSPPPLLGPNSCGTQTAGCHVGDPTPDPENTVPPSYAMPPATVSLDPCDGSEEQFPSATVSLDNDGDLLYDGADPDCLPEADLALTKTGTPDPVEVNSTLTYTLLVENLGPNDANVTLDDTLPGNVTFVSATPSQGTCNPPVSGVVSCDLGLVANGATATVTIVVMPTSTGSITNTAAFTGTGNDPNPGNDSDSTATTVNPPSGLSADISVTKNVSDASPNEGATITYTITVTNNGPDDASSVQVTDLLPSGVTYVSDDGVGSYVSGTGIWTVGSLTATSSDTLNIMATVDTGTAGTTITNTATRTASTPNDPDATNDSDTADITPGPFADLSLTKTVDVANPGEGSTITYTITVTNNGPDNASGVEVTDLLPSGVSYVSDDGGGSYVSGTGIWSVGSLTTSSSGTLNIDATVDSLPEGSSITNTAVITASTPIDPDSTDNSASAAISRPGGGGGGGCALVSSSGGIAGAAGTFGVLLLTAVWFVFRRRKKK